jgi:hypothetical protein
MDPLEPPFVLERLLCLNGSPLPFTSGTMDFEDLHELAGGDKVDCDFVCLAIKAADDVHWLEKAIKVPARYWRANHAHLPLLQEMRKAIEAGKPQGNRRRMSRRTGVVVAIEIRDKILLMQNKLGLVLCSRPGEEEETVRWFLEEVGKDVKHLQDLKAEAQDEAGDVGQEGIRKRALKKGGGHRVPTDDDDPEQSLIQTALSRIRDHPQCHHVIYLPSRHCFKLIKKNDSTDKHIYIKGLTKKRKEAFERQDDRAQESIQKLFEQAIGACFEFLELANGSSSSRVPLGV